MIYTISVTCNIYILLRPAGFKAGFHFNRIVTYHSIFFCVETISSTLVLGNKEIRYVSVRYGWSGNRPLQSISANSSVKCCEVRCEAQKFVMKFTNQFVKLAFDWLLSNVQPITNFVYKPVCQFHCKFFNFATRFGAFQWTLDINGGRSRRTVVVSIAYAHL